MLLPIRDHNPSRRTPYVTYGIIAANIIVYLSYRHQFFDGTVGYFFADWAMIPIRITSGDGFETLFTCMFLHAGVLHIAGNMLILYIFGDNIEDLLGRLRYFLFYIASGLGADAFQIFSDPYSAVPTVGASGAVAGVMGGYLLMFPKARVDVLLTFLIFFKIIVMRAWVFLGIWFGLQIALGSSGDGSGGGVAYWAHVGGFAAGFLLILPAWSRLGGSTFWKAHDGHPDHPEADSFRVPRIIRRRSSGNPGGDHSEDSAARKFLRKKRSPWERSQYSAKRRRSPWSRTRSK